MLWIGNPSSDAIRAAMSDCLIGCIATPAQGNKIPPASLWCVDNGCGPGEDGRPGTGYRGDTAYLDMLYRLAADRDITGGDDPWITGCLFAVAPDVVGDAQATLHRSRYFLEEIRSIGYPVALVGQDGLEDLTPPWDDFDVFFIGGSTEWKLGLPAARLAAEARRRGKRVHMGRVNTLQRLRWAFTIGCDTVDGGCFRYAPDINLAKMLRWLDQIHDQDALWDISGELDLELRGAA